MKHEMGKAMSKGEKGDKESQDETAVTNEKAFQESEVIKIR